jgi:hypothetical protein
MDISALSQLYETAGPFASVTLDVGHDNEAGAKEHELRVRTAGAELADQGVRPEIVERISERLSETVEEPAPVARTVVATADSVVFDELLHVRVDQPVVDWGALPDLAPWVQAEDRAVSFVLAVVDHEGGDVAVYRSDVPEPVEDKPVQGETEHVHKVRVGGWSSPRYQRETENVWRRNADAVADEIESLVRGGQRLVLLAGDPRSRTEVMDRLAHSFATVLQLESGSRAPGAEDALRKAVHDALVEHFVTERVALVHQLTDRLGRDDSVATGVHEVADAFVRGQVETLLLDPAAAAELKLTPAEHPGLALGSAPADQALRADQALIAAAALTGAQVVVSPRSTLGGTPVAALLRWDQPSA